MILLLPIVIAIEMPKFKVHNEGKRLTKLKEKGVIVRATTLCMSVGGNIRNIFLKGPTIFQPAGSTAKIVECDCNVSGL